MEQEIWTAIFGVAETEVNPPPPPPEPEVTIYGFSRLLEENEPCE